MTRASLGVLSATASALFQKTGEGALGICMLQNMFVPRGQVMRRMAGSGRPRRGRSEDGVLIAFCDRASVCTEMASLIDQRIHELVAYQDDGADGVGDDEYVEWGEAGFGSVLLALATVGAGAPLPRICSARRAFWADGDDADAGGNDCGFAKSVRRRRRAHGEGNQRNEKHKQWREAF